MHALANSPTPDTAAGAPRRATDTVGPRAVAAPGRNGPGTPAWRLALAALAPLALFGLFALFGVGGGTFPPGLNHDAAWHGRYALRILSGSEPFAVFTKECWGQENLFSYTLAGFFRLFGAGKTQIELHATLYGALGVLAFFALMYDLERSVRRAAFGASLFAVSGALVLYSRVGWRLISLAPVVCLIALAAFRCLRRPGRLHAALLGMLVGVSFYTYLQARVLVAYLLAFWLVRWFSRRPGPERRGELRLAGVSLLAYAVVALPMWVYAFNHFLAWNSRASFFFSHLGWRDVLPNLAQCLGFFDWNGRTDDFYTDFPVLEGLCHGLWLLGLGLALARWRTTWPLLLLFGALLLPTAVTQPNFQRAFGVLPVVYVFIAQAALWLGERLRAWQRPRIGVERSARLATAAAVALVGAQTLSTWHKLYVRGEPFAWGFYPEATAAGLYLGAHRGDGGPGFAVCAQNFPQDTLRFLANPTLAEDPAPFRNYEGYTSLSGDGTGELLADLAAGRLPPDRRVVVEEEINEAFTQRLADASYRLVALDLIRDPSHGKVVARVYRLTAGAKQREAE